MLFRVCELEMQDNVYFGTENNLQRIKEIAIFEQILRIYRHCG
jgi:hypothetical protein